MQESTRTGALISPAPRFYSLELPSWATSPTATAGASSGTRPQRRRLWRPKRRGAGAQR
jgi:hypothetical protein